ncbi:MAG: CPBP family intramembrane metalloprotease [Bacillota bacterium]|nr:CPBP family intramembrane metalloprotease [Bacillota bacterium]
MLNSLRKNIKYIEEVSIIRALLCLAILPLTIVLLNIDIFRNKYIETIVVYLIMITYSFVIGRKDLLLKPTGTVKTNVKIVFYIVAASAVLKWLGASAIRSNNPQHLSGVVYTGKQYLQLNSLLPLIGLAEEFLCVLTFIGLYSLLTKGRLRKFVFSLIMTSMIFGFLHAFQSPLTAVLAIGLGHIPFIFATFYYRSILPAVIAHMVWDGMNFFGHYNQNMYFMFYSVLIIVYLVYLFIPEKRQSQFN